jgi:hypothetical protein
MARQAIRYSTGGKRPGTKRVTAWQLVGFPGPNGAESRGIVDVLAIRKDHRASFREFRRGDLFEMVLLQVKGGGARAPSGSDVNRLRAVQRRLRARDVVLVSWRRGTGPKFYLLGRGLRDRDTAWRQEDPSKIFGAAGR